MLLKFVKTSNAAGAGSSSSNSTTLSARGTGMRMTMSTASTMSSRIHRKGFRIPNKRHPGKAIPSKLHSINRPISGKLVPGKRLPQRPHPPHCDNSNDSGLGFDQHVDQSAAALANNSNNNNNSTHISNLNLNLNHTSGSSTSSAASCSSSTSSSSSSSSSSTSTNLPTNALQLQQQQQRHDLQAQQPQQAPHPHHLQQQQSHHHSHFQQHSHHNKHQAHHQHHQQQQQASTSAASGSSLHHSPQQQQHHHHHHQHLIRAIPASRFISAGKRGLIRVANKRQPAVPQNSIAASQNGQVQLEIMLQPEQQHRARYQTEGSRGAVKDRSGNGFPIVRLTGYNKPTVLQVFIGTDVGRVAPHMFYQACKVAGKNSTQCNERKVDGTMVIEIDFKPETEMTVTCDCVGILKERNVDVEHRFPDHLAQKNKKKSTRCRMVFRTEITHDDGTTETLQVCSNPIICTQPPGVPEICKKSLNSCPVDGGLELFIIGKNFLKDTQVIFQETYDHPNNDNGSSSVAVTSAAATAAQDLQMQPLAAGVVDTATPAAAATTATTLWEQTVLPDKEYLQQTHLICTVPPYIHQNIMKPITVQVSIISSGKKSESHSFVYTPKGSYTKLAAATALSIPFNGSGSLSAAQDASCLMDGSIAVVNAAQQEQQQQQSLWGPSSGVVAETKHEIDSGMMPPPITTQIPMGVRRPSLNTATPMITDQQLAHLSAAAVEVLKTELLDENSQGALAEAAVAAAAAVNMHSPESLQVCSPHSPTALQYRSRYARKQSLDAMMYEQSNSLPGYPVAVAPNASTNMEVAAVQAAMEMVVKSELAQELMQAHHQHQQEQAGVTAVDKFITDIAKSTAVVSNVVAPVPDASSLFGVSAANQTVAAIDHALNDILQQQQDSVLGAEPLQRSLSISSNSSSSNGSTMTSPLNNSGASPSGSGSSSSSLSSLNNSPHAQDIILNSEPAASLSTLPMQQLGVTGELTVATTSSTASAAATANSLSTDIIMNASVSPSTILCSANGAARAVVPNIMAPHQVTMANSILNDIAMQPQPTQQDAAVAALALSNIIMSPTSANGDVLPAAPTGAVQPEVTTATSTAVSNMIIKAAADFISNQEHQAQHHHHNSHHHSQQQQQQQQLQQQLMPHGHQQLQHFNAADHQQSQQSQSPSQQQQQSQVQQQQQQLLPTSPAAVAAAASTDPLVNLLLNQPSVASGDVVVPSQYPLGIAPATPSESLIVALATENSLQKSVAAVAAVTTNGAVTTASAAADILPNAAVAVGVVPAVGANGVVALPPPIPQELTTMSDQDLISYINPSTFDQL